MSFQLSSTEVEQFTKALLDAFPSQGDLERLVYFRLGEQLNQLTKGGGTYRDVVKDLVVWANSQGQVDKLLEQARDMNPGNPQLRQFEEQIRRIHAPTPVSPLSSSPLTPVIREKLITVLMKTSVAETFGGRSSLLSGVPGVDTLRRDEHIKRHDLELVVDQLDSRGKPISGDWPLLRLIDNAMRYLAGYEGVYELQNVRQTLVSAYQEV